MMKAIKKEIKPHLLHQKIRNASFVPIESDNTKKFKYNIELRIGKYLNKRLLSLKAIGNKLTQRPQLWLKNVDFKSIIRDGSVWTVEALIEGTVINFVVWILIGWRFSLVTIFAWGFAVKQLLSLYWRLRRDGTNSTIFKKNQ